MTTTPLPAASPSSLTTYGGAERVERGRDLARASCRRARSAVGTPAAAITSLANALRALELRPPRGDGPKQAIPRAAHGVGDPGDQRRLRTDHDQVGAEVRGQGRPRPRRRAGRPACRVATSPIPGLPGAACTSVTDGSRESASASACSRPPVPITRVLTRASLVSCGARPDRVRSGSVAGTMARSRTPGAGRDSSTLLLAAPERHEPAPRRRSRRAPVLVAAALVGALLGVGTRLLTGDATPSADDPGQQPVDQNRLARVSYDGDARSDVAIQTLGVPGRLLVFTSGESGSFADAVEWSRVPGTINGVRPSRLNGDVDGDGRTDAITIAFDGSRAEVSVLRSTGDAFGSPRCGARSRASAVPRTSSPPVTSPATG